MTAKLSEYQKFETLSLVGNLSTRQYSVKNRSQKKLGLITLN